MNPFNKTSGAKAKPVAPSAAPQPVQPPAPAPAAEKLTPEALAQLRNINSVYFDAATGKTYTEDGVCTPFTFEVPMWTGPYNLHFAWPFLNPLSFATKDCAEKVRAIILRWLCSQPMAFHGWKVTVDDKQNVTGPFTRTIERRIIVTRFMDADIASIKSEHSVGDIANSLIRQPESVAKRQFLAELKSSGFSEVMY